MFLVVRIRGGARSVLGLVLVLVLVAAALGCQPADEGPTRGVATAPHFIGSQACAACHPAEVAAFASSEHAVAMQRADEQTVLGRFDGTTITHRGVESTFFRRDGKYLVRTEGPDGKPGEFEVAYTFGVDPLQQYLIPFPGGRLQALGLAWDTRPREHGGQRWFSLYPGQTLAPQDPLHWTGREQTWNYQCAECHSTDLQKRYVTAKGGYATTWAELTISCEACHGPGSAHVAWAKARPVGAPPAGAGTNGLVVRLGRREGAWTVKDAERGIAEWTGPPRISVELDVCARCHARRRPILEPYPYGQPLLDTHVPALLDPGLYHADGQILDEVYEWGSFVQSRMHRAGVTCSDCHDPHRAALRAEGNAVCTRCHLPAKFDTPAHHRHRVAAEASRCVTCHMPSRTYMVVDPRRDHGFRVPRPDLSAALGTPNVCTDCHRERAPKWAADRIAAWRGSGRPPASGFAPALDAARRGLAEAGPALARLAGDRSQPGIARATAVAHLGEFLTAGAAPAVIAGLRDPDPLIRMAAARAAEALPAERRGPLVAPLLRDPVRAVRLAAAHALAGVSVPEAQRGDLDRGITEWVRAEQVSADRPEAHVNLAGLYARTGRTGDAESALRTALRLDPRFVPALVNLADLLRAQGRDTDGERMLEQALRAHAEHPEALHALGLLRVRQRQLPEAVVLLRRAATARPESSRFAYVYAVSLHDTGRAADAIGVLETAHRGRPADREVLAGLASYLAERGDIRRALEHAEKLVALDPDDVTGRRLVETLRGRTGGR